MKKSTGYNMLINKLNRFVRKYYTNQLIKGSLIFLGFNLLLFIIFNVMEAQFYFSAFTRKILFYSGLMVMSSTFLYWVGLPLFRMFRLGKTISHDEAAAIIGNHFPEVKDKLLNILQLARQSGQTENDLLLHSIEQKTNDIKLVSFPKAIDFNKNRRYLKYTLPPLLLLLVLLFSAPSMITDSSYRLFHNNEEFARQAPFTFHLNNNDLALPQFEDIQLLMHTEGDVQPQEAYITVDDFQYKMKKNEKGLFSYTMKNVGNDTDFFFTANGFSSTPFAIKILKKPSLARMNIQLDFPSYTGMEDKSLLNEGDMIIPDGTKVNWTFDTENMSNLGIKFKQNDIDTLLNTRNNIASYEQRIYRDNDYKLIFNSLDIPDADSVLYSIKAIPDEYPKISLQNKKDSLNSKVHYIVGEASDDYGILKITYNYAIIPEGAKPGEEINFQSEPIKNTTGKATTYDKIIDVANFDLKPGAALWYYFEVYDNDGVHGSKSTKTPMQQWTQKTLEEFEKLEESTEEDIKSNLEDVLEKQQKLIESTEELRNKLLQEKELTWQRKKEMEKLMQNQQSIQQKLQQTQEMHEQNSQNQEEFKNNNQENNKEIQKMMEQARNPELEKLMQKIQELMEKMKKDEAIKELEQMSQQMNQSEMDMERLQQLYEKLEMESDLTDQAQKLEKLAEDQKKLAEENLDEEEVEEKTNEEISMDEENAGEEKTDEERTDEEKTDEENISEENKKDSEESSQNKSEEEKNDEQKQNSGDKADNNQEKKEQNSDNESKEEKIEKQEKVNEDFEKISKDLEKLFEKNKELDNPAQMDDPKTPSEEIKKDQNESMDQMQSGSPQKAGQKQKKAGQKMQQMAESMQQSMQSGQQKQMQEDIKALRQILENLVKLSFDQETLIDEVATMSYATPQYVEKVRVQFDLKNDFTLIQDSLLALANRNPQIQGTVTEKVNLIDTHIGKSLKLLEEQEKSDAANDQRRTMKNVNDLALMLTESLQNMQMQMSSANAMCQNPGQKPGSQAGSTPMDKISKGQKKLTQEMKDMAQKRKDGKGGQMSKDFAQTAAEQAAMRKMLEEKQQKLMEQGKGSKQIQQLIDMMDKMETDLVNKKLTNEMMERQHEILTRLLEAEKAERQQDMDEQRKSEEAKDIARTLPPDLQKYLDQRREEITPYQKLSPALKPYYKQLVEEYYDELKNR